MTIASWFLETFYCGQTGEGEQCEEFSWTRCCCSVECRCCVSRVYFVNLARMIISFIALRSQDCQDRFLMVMQFSAIAGSGQCTHNITLGHVLRLRVQFSPEKSSQRRSFVKNIYQCFDLFCLSKDDLLNGQVHVMTWIVLDTIKSHLHYTFFKIEFKQSSFFISIA